jgi:hypothetical protein
MCNTRTRYKFLGREGNRYVWESTRRIDSRVERITCNIYWFWSYRPTTT